MNNESKKFADYNAIHSAMRWKAVTPSDVTNLWNTENRDKDIEFRDRIPRALYVGEFGDVVVEDVMGTVVTFRNVGSGVILPIQPQKVMEATTATDIIALY